MLRPDTGASNGARQSALFTKTRREAPKDEVSKNAQLLIRAGYIYKEMAGVYAYLPLGLRVLEHIKKIVREELSRVGGQEIIMTSLQRKELWEKTDRWSDEAVDVWFKSILKSGGDVGFGWSHEEPITDMMRSYIGSYRDLPVYVHQFQTKLRNELRAKSGIMRGREFLMSDMYSYTKDEESHETFYNQVVHAYKTIFARAGIGEQTFFTFASGGAFTEFSHEFQTISEAGEDTIYIDRTKGIAINEEVLGDGVLQKLGLQKDELEKATSIEVGNIFGFGDTKSTQLGLSYRDDEGKMHPVILGSYGIGITRLMGTIVELFADEKGIVWPEEVAPYQIHLVSIPGKEKEAVMHYADELYQELVSKGVKVLYDDRDVSAGEKFADSDLIGIPTRIIVGREAVAGDMIEVVDRKTGDMKKQTREEVAQMISL